MTAKQFRRLRMKIPWNECSLAVSKRVESGALYTNPAASVSIPMKDPLRWASQGPGHREVGVGKMK
jgi:hypothetical protein